MGGFEIDVEPLHRRQWSGEQMSALFTGGWPAFIEADVVAAALLPRVRRTFASFEIAGVDQAAGELIGAAWGVPIQWDETRIGLPGGYSDSLERALADHDLRRPVNTLVVAAAQVRADRVGAGIASQLIRGLSRLAVECGLSRVVAPLRPSGKDHYPRMPIQDYADWRRPDGRPFDPWLRTHLRLGGQIIGTSAASQVFTGTLDQWQSWSGQALPVSGEYIVPQAISPLIVDLTVDLGTLTEPCIWVRHR